jgi:hypothetical protein
LLLPERRTTNNTYKQYYLDLLLILPIGPMPTECALVIANIIFCNTLVFLASCVFLDGFLHHKYQLQSIISQSFSADCLAWVSIPFKLEGLEFNFGFTCFFLEQLPIHLIFLRAISVLNWF